MSSIGFILDESYKQLQSQYPSAAQMLIDYHTDRIKRTLEAPKPKPEEIQRRAEDTTAITLRHAKILEWKDAVLCHKLGGSARFITAEKLLQISEDATRKVSAQHPLAPDDVDPSWRDPSARAGDEKKQQR